MAKKTSLLEQGPWLRRLSLPLALGAIYYLLFAWFVSSARPLPPGVNLAFVQVAWPGLLGLAMLAGLAARLLPRTRPSKAAKPTGLRDHQRHDWLLTLLPLAPVLQYAIANQSMLSASEILVLLLVFWLPAVALVVWLPAALSRFVDPRLLRVIGLVLAFMLTNMVSLSSVFRWYEQGDLVIQLAILLGLSALVAGLYLSGRSGLLAVLATVFFLSSAFVKPAGLEAGIAVTEMRQHPLFAHLAGRQPTAKPNVYLLIYDAYVPNEVMLQYGIDNSEQEDYLVDQGFKLYPHTYSIGAYSVASMSPVLNISAHFYGNTRSGTSGAGVVPMGFRDLGYTTYGYFGDDYFLRSVGSGYDISFPEPRPVSSILADGILLGEFRFDLGFENATTDEMNQRKHELFTHIPDDPFFLYSHIFFPAHSQNSGACLPDETQLFAERLELANQQMRVDLGELIENDPGAIVIVAGDHGPYLSKNCFSTGEGGYSLREITRYDIQDRFGAFLAIRWPDEEYAGYDQITVLQDIFPAVFAYLFRDLAILSVRVPPVTVYEPSLVSGAIVEDGIIRGGADDGEPLFLAP